MVSFRLCARLYRFIYNFGAARIASFFYHIAVTQSILHNISGKCTNCYNMHKQKSNFTIFVLQYLGKQLRLKDEKMPRNVTYFSTEALGITYMKIINMVNYIH